jgi:crossover junction endodeoxyribonuclease RusA
MTDTVPRGTVTLADGSTFVLPIGHRKPLNANQVTYSRGGAIARNERVREFRKIVTARCREARIPAGQTHVHVTLHYVPKERRRRDADNLVPTLKPCIDGLRDARVIPDDTPDHVTWEPPVIHPADPRNPRLWLEVTLRPRESEANCAVSQP